MKKLKKTTPHPLKEEMKRLLKKKGLTIRDWSRLLEISYSHLCRVLNGSAKPSPKLELELYSHHMQLVNALYDKGLMVFATVDEKGVEHYSGTDDATGYDFKFWKEESGEVCMEIISPKRGKQLVH